MNGETNLDILLQQMNPLLNKGDFVFCVVQSMNEINPGEIIGFFREEEGLTVIVSKETADKLQLDYSFIASWITLSIHSSLDAVGLTAAFSTALANEAISCNVVAAFYHDHLFINKKDAVKAMEVLNYLSNRFGH